MRIAPRAVAARATQPSSGKQCGRLTSHGQSETWLESSQPIVARLDVRGGGAVR